MVKRLQEIQANPAGLPVHVQHLEHPAPPLAHPSEGQINAGDLTGT
jgi:hypothetical protein